MATVTEYASGASGTSWTTPTNANADDGSYATYTLSSKTTTGNVNTLTSFGFDSSIAAGSTITSVALEVQHKVSTTGGIAFLECAVAISGTPGTFNSDSTEPTTDTAVTYATLARPGGGAWTRADLLDAVFTVQLRARSGNSASPVVYSWNYARVVVVYERANHANTGALTGPGSTVAGTASSSTARPSSGVLVGAGSVVTGSASSSTARPSSGVLTGAGSTVVGSAARTRVHATSGVLTGAGAVVVGSADRQDAAEPVTHDTSGALVGQGSIVVGSASSATTRATSGALVGPGSIIAGTAARVGAAVSHATSGALVGAGSVVTGSAASPIDAVPVGGGIGHGGKSVKKPGIVVVTVDGQDYRVPADRLQAFLDGIKEEVKEPEVVAKKVEKRTTRKQEKAYASPQVVIKSAPVDVMQFVRAQVDRSNEIIAQIWAGTLARKVREMEMDEDETIILMLIT